jgi:4-amino-4-deoxychorismate lyase
MDHWWINGKPGSLIEVTDRGFAYGDGLFETVAVRGGRPRFLAHHLDRLFDGCRRLRIPAPAREPLQTAVTTAVSDLPHGTLKLMVTRGTGPRGYQLPEFPATTVLWGTMASDPVRSVPVEIRWCDTMTSVNPATAGLKTLGRLDQVLARAEWSRTDVAEGLMTTTDGHLIGGTASNVFLVSGDHLQTPSVARAGIAGVMRRVVIDAARSAGIPVAVGDVPPFQVQAASEIFVTNALTGIRPVHRLGSQVWAPGPVTRRLQKALAAAGVTECGG